MKGLTLIPEKIKLLKSWNKNARNRLHNWINSNFKWPDILYSKLRGIVLFKRGKKIKYISGLFMR